MDTITKVTTIKARKINPLVMGYVMTLTLLAAAGYSIGDYSARQQEHRDPLTHTTQVFATDVGYVNLPRMNMSLGSGTGQAGRVRIDMSIAVPQKDVARLEDYQPIITDRLVRYVGKMNMDDVREPDVIPLLRRQLLQEVNSSSSPVPVLDIIFRQFLIM